MKICILLALLGVAACTTPGKSLPMVKDTDPIWALVPDHISPADLPR